MSNEFQLKKFEDYKDQMPMQDILTFAKFGFISQQILKNENLLHSFQEMIKCTDKPG